MAELQHEQQLKNNKKINKLTSYGEILSGGDLRARLINKIKLLNKTSFKVLEDERAH